MTMMSRFTRWKNRLRTQRAPKETVQDLASEPVATKASHNPYEAYSNTESGYVCDDPYDNVREVPEGPWLPTPDHFENAEKADKRLDWLHDNHNPDKPAVFTKCTFCKSIITRACNVLADQKELGWGPKQTGSIPMAHYYMPRPILGAAA